MNTDKLGFFLMTVTVQLYTSYTLISEGSSWLERLCVAELVKIQLDSEHFILMSLTFLKEKV